MNPFFFAILYPYCRSDVLYYFRLIFISLIKNIIKLWFLIQNRTVVRMCRKKNRSKLYEVYRATLPFFDKRVGNQIFGDHLFFQVLIFMISPLIWVNMIPREISFIYSLIKFQMMKDPDYFFTIYITFYIRTPLPRWLIWQSPLPLSTPSSSSLFLQGNVYISFQPYIW